MLMSELYKAVNTIYDGDCHFVITNSTGYKWKEGSIVYAQTAPIDFRQGEMEEALFKEGVDFSIESLWTEGNNHNPELPVVFTITVDSREAEKIIPALTNLRRVLRLTLADFLNMKEVDGYWIDESGNKWDSQRYSKLDAIKFSKTLFDCTGCLNCKNGINCTNCKDCISCVGCEDCTSCNDCENCADCISCNSCKNCEGCTSCNGCEECEECMNCKNCTDCEECTNCEDCINCKHCINCEDCSGCEDYANHNNLYNTETEQED